MKYFEDFEVGYLIVTRGRTVTEADIVNFACLTGDWHPLHTDVEYAKETIFGERIAHGMLVLSFGTGLWANLMADWAFIAFYGAEDIRFMKPVRIGDTIHVDLEVIGKLDKDRGRGVIQFRQLVKNGRGEDVSTGIFNLMFEKRQNGE